MTQREFIAEYVAVKPKLVAAVRRAKIEDAEDIVHTTMLELCRNHGYADVTDSVYGFLYNAVKLRILRESSDTYASRHVRNDALSIDELDEALHPTTNPYPEIDLKVAVEQALTQLPDDVAVAVRLVHMEGYTVEEVAERLKMSMRTLQKRLQRAMPKLRALLAEYKPA